MDIERIKNKEGKTEQKKVIFDSKLPKKIMPKRFDSQSQKIWLRNLFWAFCGSNYFLVKCCNKKNGVPVCRHCKGEHISCTNNCNYFKTKKIKKMGKINLKESINKFCLN